MNGLLTSHVWNWLCSMDVDDNATAPIHCFFCHSLFWYVIVSFLPFCQKIQTGSSIEGKRGHLIDLNRNVFTYDEFNKSLPQACWISVPTTTLACPVIQTWCRQASMLWRPMVPDWALSDSSVAHRYGGQYTKQLDNTWITTNGFTISSLCLTRDLQDLHKNLEQKLAEFHEREDCILYASCFDANAGLFEVCHARTLWQE